MRPAPPDEFRSPGEEYAVPARRPSRRRRRRLVAASFVVAVLALLAVTLVVLTGRAQHQHPTRVTVPTTLATVAAPTQLGALTAVATTEPGNVTVAFDAPGLTWAPDGKFTPGAGHVHVVVDDTDYGSYYEPLVTLALPAGAHRLTATLSATDHRIYTRDGAPMSVALDIVVP